MRCWLIPLISATAAALSSTPAPSLAGDVVVYSDDFATGLGEWTFWTDASAEEPYSYSASHEVTDGSPSPCLRISGDFDTADAVPTPASRRFGVERLFPNISRFHLSFDWRATSDFPTTTNMTLQIVSASDGTLLYSRQLLSGSTLDSGWLTFPPTDLSDVVPTDSETDVLVRLMLSDAWTANHQQVVYFDSLLLVATDLPEPPVVPVEEDSFDLGTDPWTFWAENPSVSNSYGLSWDEGSGDAPPSAVVQGNYAYSGATWRWGLERTVPITIPFVLTADWEVDGASAVTAQLLAPDGSLRHTWFVGDAGPGWETYGPTDLTTTVVGLTEATLRFWIVGSANGSPANALWLDNVSWTAPCDATLDFFADGDGDGFGNLFAPYPFGPACYAPTGFVEDTTDCDDDDPNRFPGNEEACNGEDDDCDPATDLEGTDLDADGDGLLDCAEVPPDDDDAVPDDDDSGAVSDDDDVFGGDDDDGNVIRGDSGCGCGIGPYDGGGWRLALAWALVARLFLTRRRRSGAGR